MTRVCLVGDEGLQLSYELLSRETAREALAAYDLNEPYHNTVAVETVSLGAAVALLNDLDWYLSRFASEAMVLEPSVSETEWLSRELAAAIRNENVDPDETGRLLKIYGLEPLDNGGGKEAASQSQNGAQGRSAEESQTKESGSDTTDGAGSGPDGLWLVEPMFVARTGGGLPEYDLRDVEETLLVRVTEEEFEA